MRLARSETAAGPRPCIADLASRLALGPGAARSTGVPGAIAPSVAAASTVRGVGPLSHPVHSWATPEGSS